jgi:5-bromo-4-chloroindolyl phosphate hydrolysis protein
MNEKNIQSVRANLHELKQYVRRVEKDLCNIKNFIYMIEEDVFDAEELAMMNIKLVGGF